MQSVDHYQGYPPVEMVHAFEEHEFERSPGSRQRKGQQEQQQSEDAAPDSGR